MGKTPAFEQSTSRVSLYAEVTQRIIADLESGIVPWVQPWDSASCACAMPHNASSGRRYSGINILILWSAVIARRFSSQRWLTYRQALALGGNVRAGERGTIICYADRFTPKAEQDRASDDGSEARRFAFLKRFTVFNVDQCDYLPDHVRLSPPPRPHEEIIPEADALIAATQADVRIGGSEAFYMPELDLIRVPPQAAFADPVNWYRTAFHELGHWTGHHARLDRPQNKHGGEGWYGREELVAEMTTAFVCAQLGIAPTVRHADYLGLWLQELHADQRAIFRAASQASKAADYILAFAQDGDRDRAIIA